MNEEYDAISEDLDPELALLMEEVAEILDETDDRESRVDSGKDSAPSRRSMKEDSGSKRRRMVSVRLATLIAALAVMGTAVALTQNALPFELLELWNTQYQTTDFSITTFDTKPQGRNKLTIDITLANNDVSTHHANVTVYILNTTGDELANQTAATGAVAGGGTWSNSFVFNLANVVNDYENSLVVVDQSS